MGSVKTAYAHRLSGTIWAGEMIQLDGRNHCDFISGGLRIYCRSRMILAYIFGSSRKGQSRVAAISLAALISPIRNGDVQLSSLQSPNTSERTSNQVG